MIGYVGTAGALVALPYMGGLDTSSDRPASFTKTLGGRNKAFIARRARREWGVDVDLAASLDTAGLVEITRSAGEVMWYPADATSGNLFSPQAAGFETIPESATDAGLAALPDGTVARTVVSSATVRVGDAHGTYERVPLKAGSPVTVGAWSIGGQSFRGFWRDAAGGNITNWSAPVRAWTGWGWHEYTLTPPAGASFVELHLAGGTQYARPVVSWGEKAQDRPGRGCPKAVVHGLSEALTVISQADAYGSIGVTITEVG